MESLHHANIIVGTLPARETVISLLKTHLDFEVAQNPDFLVLESESFGIDEARALALWAIGKPLVGEYKVLFLTTGSITLEAQNALLKVLEEPPRGTHFMIAIPSLANLLDTLLSRVRVLDVSVEAESKKSLSGEFLDAKVGSRLGLIRRIEKSKNKADLKVLINDLEKVAASRGSDYQKRRNILTAKVLASARGSSPRVLLEWLACVL